MRHIFVGPPLGCVTGLCARCNSYFIIDSLNFFSCSCSSSSSTFAAAAHCKGCVLATIQLIFTLLLLLL